LDRRREVIFYQLVLPVLALVNLVLAVIVVSSLNPSGWMEWLAVATAGFCCTVAGWLAASIWSKSYWARVIARQVTTWRRMADTILGWIEELPVSDEALDRLRRSLDETAPQRSV